MIIMVIFGIPQKNRRKMILNKATLTIIAYQSANDDQKARMNEVLGKYECNIRRY